MTTRTSPTLADLDNSITAECRGLRRAAQVVAWLGLAWLVSSTVYLYLHATNTVAEDGARYILGPCVGFALLALGLFNTVKSRSEKVTLEWQTRVVADITYRYSTTLPARTIRADTHPRVVLPRGATTSFTGGFPNETAPYRLESINDNAPNPIPVRTATEKVTQ